jgi:hypothetical protein
LNTGKTFAMPDTTDIRPINIILTAIYNEALEKVREEFLVGRLFGLRSSIVHDGAKPAIHGDVLQYVNHLYTDILFHIVGQPTEQRAKKYLSLRADIIREFFQKIASSI